MVRASISETTCSILRWITFTRWLAAATRRVLSRTEEHEEAIATVVSRDAECVLARAPQSLWLFLCIRVKQVVMNTGRQARRCALQRTERRRYDARARSDHTRT